MNKTKKLEGLLNRSGWLTKRWANGQDVNDERKGCNKEIAELIFPGEEEEEEEDWEPDFLGRKEILDIPVFDEYRIHFMGLAGWAYRNIDKHPNMVHQQIYELARRVRISGAGYMRTFLINGSRKKSERYIMDALPWEMIRMGGAKIIDFDKSNKKWWRVVRIIEEACKYWGIQHQPTFRMAGYNRDIFNEVNNIQGIHGEWSEGSAEITIKFMRDYMEMQKDIRKASYKPAFEFLNEPQCVGDHEKLGLIADYHLRLWRGVEDMTTIDRAMTCSGACEGAHANFVEKHWFDGRYYGSDEFKSRKVIPEFHGVSTLQTLLGRGKFIHGVGSGWRHLAYNEDGCGNGSYSPIPWSPFRLANAEELNDMLWYAYTESAKKNKKFIFTCFMLDCLRQDKNDNMIAKEEFDEEQIENMNWDRAIQYRKMREEL